MYTTYSCHKTFFQFILGNIFPLLSLLLDLSPKAKVIRKIQVLNSHIFICK